MKRRCMRCNSEELNLIHKGTRDNGDIDVLRCTECRIKMLSSTSQVMEEFYENSGMHENSQMDYKRWCENTKDDDARRAVSVENMIHEELIKNAINIVDFGCGNGGFIRNLKLNTNRTVSGVELEYEARKYMMEDGIEVKKSIQEYSEKFDLVTMFHVIEHIIDPAVVLEQIKSQMSEGGYLLIETPNAEDALLEFYECESFADYTYWSPHVCIYNSQNIVDMLQKNGFEIIVNEQIQRYPITNHLYWLAKGKPGGHIKYSDMFDEEMNHLYIKKLKELGKCDTLYVLARIR